MPTRETLSDYNQVYQIYDNYIIEHAGFPNFTDIYEIPSTLTGKTKQLRAIQIS